MKRFFLPGKKLIDRLTYPQKMAFMGLVFSVPIAVFLYMLASGLATGMALAKEERTGLEFNRSVAEFLKNLQQHRGMASAYLNGDTSFEEKLRAKRSEVDGNVMAVSVLQEELGGKLGTGRLWGDAKEGWLVLKASFSGMTAEESFENHTELTGKVLELMRHVADLTRPSLRTSLDAYHLTDALVLDVPMASEYQGRIRGIGAGAIVPRTLSETQRYRLLALTGLAGEKLGDMEERFAKAFGANPRLADPLQSPLEEALTLGRSALTLLEEEVIFPEEVRIGPAEYFDTFTRAIDASFRLHGETATVLDGLLRAQEETMRRKMYLIGGGTLATALLLLYLFAGSYFSVMHSLSALVAASRRIGKGDTFVTVSLEARDEMTQVAESFNEMAESIASFTAELTSTNEALRAEVAERKLAEENLRASEEQYRVIAETSSDGIVTIDDESRIIFANSALREMFGYTLEEMLGKPLTVLMPERYRTGHLGGVGRYLATGKKSRSWHAQELTGLHRSGGEIPLEISYGTFTLDGNRYFTGFIRDISERREAEKEKAYKNMLEQFNREIETMVAERTTSLLALKLADSVRTPASVIGWSGKKLLEKGCDYERAKESITDIVEEAGRLDNLVQEFHALIESKRSAFTYIDINEIVREVLFIIEKEAQDKALALEKCLSEAPLKLNAQRELLRMAVFTLLRNAVESTPEGGTVTLGTEAADHAAVLTVSDTGPGIPAQALERIFDPSYSAKFFRFGMGLPLIKQIVSEHLGDIEVQSTEGKGTTFRVVLPTRWMELSEKPGPPR